MQAIADTLSLNSRRINLTGLHAQTQNFFAGIQCLPQMRIVIEGTATFGAGSIGHQGCARCGMIIIGAGEGLRD